ncbi:MAG TPA: FAD-dependent oxidoreductase [Polyangia bacterium]
MLTTAPTRHRLRLVEGRMLSPSVRGLRFTAEGPPPTYRPGQSMDLLVPTRGGLVMRRPYSVASAPGHAGPGALDFAVTRVEGGPTSTALHALQPGAMVEAVGPNRGWLARRDDERQVAALLVATGSGLAPFRAVLQADLTAAQGPPIALVFGCRTQADILWRTELEQWAERVPRFSLTVTLSRPDAEWRGATGWVQRHVLEAVRRLDPGVVLLCGLSPMTDAVERLLVGAGVAAARIRVEAYDS